MSIFAAALRPVGNRGTPPVSFLEELLAWGKAAPDEIFAPNRFHDVYTNVKSELGFEGTWPEGDYRRAVMLEVLRVLAGFESSWKWNEGVDTTNARSMANPASQEAGIFQVSFDSMQFDNSLSNLVFRRTGFLNPSEFIHSMKTDHTLALEYAARLLRFTVNHNGPVKRNEINHFLSRDAVKEFQRLLA